jgi:hypothetical protein
MTGLCSEAGFLTYNREISLKVFNGVIVCPPPGNNHQIHVGLRITKMLYAPEIKVLKSNHFRAVLNSRSDEKVHLNDI